MKKILLALPCLLMLGLAAKGQQKQSIRGYLVDSISKLPIADAGVYLPQHKLLSVTDAKGYFHFDSVLGGSVLLRVSHLSYHSFEGTFKNPSEIHIELCPESTHLHDVVIEGHREKQDIFNPNPMVEINEEELARKRGQTIAEALNNQAGITTLSTGSGIGKPVIRGLTGNRLITLNNGTRQEGQQWGEEHGPELDPFAAGSIQVVKGAASVQYGPEAIGGVVKVNPRKFLAQKGYQSELNLQGYTNNRQGAASAYFEERKNSRFAYRVQGSIRKAGDAMAPQYRLSNTGFSQQNLSLAAEYDFKKWHSEWNYSFFNAKLGILRASHTGNIPDLMRAIASDTPLVVWPFSYQISRPYQQVQHQLASVKFRREWKKMGTLDLQYSWQQNHRSEYDLDKPYNTVIRNRPAFDLYLYTNTLDAKLEHKIHKHIKGLVGVQVMQQYNVAGGLSFLIPDFSALTSGVYLIEKWEKGRWFAETGGRFDYRHLKASSNYNFTAFSQTRDFMNGTFVLAGGYKPSKHSLLQANVSKGWRPPGVNELYSKGLHGGTASFEIGDSTLNPEVNYNADLSFSYKKGKWDVGVSLFRNSIKGYIYLLPDLKPTLTIRGAFPTLRFTQDNVVLTGSDGHLTWKPKKQWNFTTIYSFLYAQNVSRSQPLFRMPANRIQVAVMYEFKKRKRMEEAYIQIGWLYVAKQNRYQVGIDYASPPPAYQLFQLHVGADFLLKKYKMSCNLSVNNLLNRSYRDYLSRYRYYANEQGMDVVLRLGFPLAKHEERRHVHTN